MIKVNKQLRSKQTCLLCDGHEAELELSARLDHAAAALVPDVLESGGDVDLLAALSKEGRV